MVGGDVFENDGKKVINVKEIILEKINSIE